MVIFQIIPLESERITPQASDFYVREYLKDRYTSSQIRYGNFDFLQLPGQSLSHGVLQLDRQRTAVACPFIWSCRWTSFRCGIFVRFHRSLDIALPHTFKPNSYLMMIGGSLLFIFSLCMLSLTQPGQYYQVRESLSSKGHIAHICLRSFLRRVQVRALRWGSHMFQAQLFYRIISIAAGRWPWESPRR